jgi:hypothetical protein
MSYVLHMKLLCLIISLPTENATARQRIWRSLKTSGAAALRDGVYLLPDREDCRNTLGRLAVDTRESRGAAHVLHVSEQGAEDFISLFDRSAEYATLLSDIEQARDGLSENTVHDALKYVRKLRKAFTKVAAIDFFPGEPQRQLDAALVELEMACARMLSPDEPHAQTGVVERRHPSDYRGRLWATRQRPWVDRLASAWLIRRFIDPQARIQWLHMPADCPVDALGFDFDGATFSHVGSRVTFEVLATSFSLDSPAIAKLGRLVHYLDVGGVQPPEALGVESVLAGLRETFGDDDELLAAATTVLDGLLAGFERDP